jgi:DNA-binding GntR family transcriptional regulator
MAMLLRDSVYQAIRRAILTCEFQPGQELREQILAEKYRVSRSPVRDSLLRLEQEKLVTVLPRQGYRVNTIGRRDVEELFGLRLIIAPACSAAAARADDAAVRTLDVFREVSEGLRGAAFVEHNRAFHAAIADLSGNSRLAAVENSLVEEFDRLVQVSLQTYQNTWMPRAMADHMAIMDAIQAHDSDAAYRVTYEHIKGGHDRLIAAIQAKTEQPDPASEGESNT